MTNARAGACEGRRKGAVGEGSRGASRAHRPHVLQRATHPARPPAPAGLARLPAATQPARAAVARRAAAASHALYSFGGVAPSSVHRPPPPPFRPRARSCTRGRAQWPTRCRRRRRRPPSACGRVTLPRRALGALLERQGDGALARVFRKAGRRTLPSFYKLTDEIRKRFGLDPRMTGLVVTEVDENSPYADRLIAGMVIIEIDRMPVSEIAAAKLALTPGRHLLFVNYRGINRFVTVTVK